MEGEHEHTCCWAGTRTARTCSPSVAAVAAFGAAAASAGTVLILSTTVSGGAGGYEAQAAAAAGHGVEVATPAQWAAKTAADFATYDAAGNHSSVGVAFDGTNLLISCYSDNTVTAINPAGGSQVAVHAISGASSLGALAWDNGRGLLWACSALTTVGTIDLSANTYTPIFSTGGSGVFGPGCFDGLAYDAADDTIWASGDVSPSIEHFTVTGTQLSSNGVSLGGCPYDSGIAIGGPMLYVANNGCSQIYQVAKDFSSETFSATFPRRLEDMECDNRTFPGLGAIWSIDAYDNILNAWEIPAGTCSFGGGGEPPVAEGFMTGGGSVFTAGGMRVTHGFELQCDAATGPNNLQVNWGKGNRFHLTGLTSAACSDDASISEGMPVAGFDTYTGKGTGNYNGMPGATAEWTFTDAGEPGWADSVSLTIKDAGGSTVLSVTGTLKSGNHQAHAG